MKFKMIVGGIETIFPEFQICHFENENEMVIYFLKTNKENEGKIKKNINNPKLKIEGNFLVLLLGDIQYALDLDGYEILIDFYNNGGKIGFAFEDENDILMGIPTPTFHK